MTPHQIIVGTIIYAVALPVVVYFTRPTGRRFAGACVCAAAVTALGFSAIVPLGESLGYWHVPLNLSPGYMALLWFATAVSAVPAFLFTWRIARRFGSRGLLVTFAVAAILGPPREFAVAARFPEWITYTPGIGTYLAISVVYVVGLAAGHGVMRLVAGPARGSPLTRWPWESAEHRTHERS